MELEIIPGKYTVVQGKEVRPAGRLFSLTRTADELSVVCEEELVEGGERGWSAFRVKGTLDFGLTGILASLSKTLADAGISIFAISTFNTDVILVKDLEHAKAALEAAGHRFH